MTLEKINKLIGNYNTYADKWGYSHVTFDGETLNGEVDLHYTDGEPLWNISAFKRIYQDGEMLASLKKIKKAVGKYLELSPL